MNKLDEIKFKKNYQQLLQALKLQGKTIKTIDAYSRAVRRVVQHFNDKHRHPQKLRRQPQTRHTKRLTV